MARRYSHSDDHASFMIIVLAAGFYWKHKALVATIGRIAVVCVIVVLVVFCCIRLHRIFMRMKGLRRKDSLDLIEIDAMSGLEFERFVAELLKQRGYQNVRLTEKYDYGIDIVAEKEGITWGIQVKRCSGLVKANAVRQVVTALRMYGCDRAMVITNGYFSQVAIKLGEGNECVLVDRDDLVGWLGFLFNPDV